jgi:hypothetical protein
MRTRELAVMTAIVLSTVHQVTITSTGPPPHNRIPAELIVIPLGFNSVEATAAVRRAVTGAARRLKVPDCESVVSLFTDAANRPLSSNLPPFAQRPNDYLGILRFVDGSQSARCATSGLLAFTTPHGRTIAVCARRFLDLSQSNPTATEVIVIHELLHALGLGENPPASQTITNIVRSRCAN